MKNAITSPATILLTILLLALGAARAGVARGQGQPPPGQRLVVFEIFGRCS